MDLQIEGVKKTVEEEQVEAILDSFSIPKKRGYRFLRSIILMMHKDNSLSVRSAQRQLAKQAGLQPHNVRYAVDRVLFLASEKGSLNVIETDGEAVTTGEFIEYCVCKMPGFN